MTKITVQIQNANEVARALQQNGDMMLAILPAAVMAAARIIQDDAHQRAGAPVLDVQTTSADGAATAAALIGLLPEKWYWKFKETGAVAHEVNARKARALMVADGVYRQTAHHPGIAARPFLRPAADHSADDARAAFGKYLAQVI